MTFVDFCGIGGFVVSILGLAASWKAYREAESAKNAANQKLSAYRKRSQIDKAIHTLEGIRKSIIDDFIPVDKKIASEIRQAAITLLSRNDNLFSENLNIALDQLKNRTHPYIFGNSLSERESSENYVFCLTL